MERLEERLSEPEGFGSYTEIQQWLAEEHGVELPSSTLLDSAWDRAIRS
jgi:hypothetical protein